jgi:hypothetical protein
MSPEKLVEYQERASRKRASKGAFHAREAARLGAADDSNDAIGAGHNRRLAQKHAAMASEMGFGGSEDVFKADQSMAQATAPSAEADELARVQAKHQGAYVTKNQQGGYSVDRRDGRGASNVSPYGDPLQAAPVPAAPAVAPVPRTVTGTPQAVPVGPIPQNTFGDGQGPLASKQRQPGMIDGNPVTQTSLQPGQRSVQGVTLNRDEEWDPMAPGGKKKRVRLAGGSIDGQPVRRDPMVAAQ